MHTSEREKAYFPPIHMALQFCPVCGRDNRWAPLPEFHNRNGVGGEPCPGRPETLRYDFAGDPKEDS